MELYVVGTRARGYWEYLRADFQESAFLPEAQLFPDEEIAIKSAKEKSVMSGMDYEPLKLSTNSTEGFNLHAD